MIRIPCSVEQIDYEISYNVPVKLHVCMDSELPKRSVISSGKKHKQLNAKLFQTGL